MKKFLSLLLALCMLLACAVTLVACDGKEEEPAKKKDGGGAVSYKQYQVGYMSYKVPSDWNETMSSSENGASYAAYMKATAAETRILMLSGGMEELDEDEEVEKYSELLKRDAVAALVDKQLEEAGEFATPDEREAMIEDRLPTFVLTNEKLLEYLQWSQESAASVTITDAEILVSNDICFAYVFSGTGEFSGEAVYEYFWVITSDARTLVDGEGISHRYYWVATGSLSGGGERDDATFLTIVNSISFGNAQASNFEPHD